MDSYYVPEHGLVWDIVVVIWDIVPVPVGQSCCPKIMWRALHPDDLGIRQAADAVTA